MYHCMFEYQNPDNPPVYNQNYHYLFVYYEKKL